MTSIHKVLFIMNSKRLHQITNRRENSEVCLIDEKTLTHDVR